jgi:uncharacterized protein (TIGR03118 family)
MNHTDISTAFDKGNLLDRLKGKLTGNAYDQTNLVANKAEYHPLIVDPTFVNAWGISNRPAGAGGHFWVTAAGSGISYEYVGDVNGKPLFQDDLQEVTIPGPNGEPGTPTGTVFNGSQNFVITQDFPSGAITAPTKFLFATENGVISAWTERKRADGKLDWPSAAIPVIDRSAQGSKYFGIGVDKAGNHLYAADFGKNPQIQVFDGKFQDITASSGFKNPFDGGDGVQPGEYAPFNVQGLGSDSAETIFVTYAQTRADPEQPGQIYAGEENAGTGLGKIAAFDTQGHLLRTWGDGGLLNAPWGVAYAPENFGKFSNALLVSNFGDGTVTAFDPKTYQAIDYLRDAAGKPIQVSGIWGLLFGNGASLGDTDSLYFAAGPEDEGDGIFGRLRWDRSAPVLPADAPTSEFMQIADDLLVQNPSIVGTDANDTLFGSEQADFFQAGTGNNTLFGNEGDNVFVAADGNDVAFGGAGRDLFDLGDGNNTMYGNDGINLFLTGKGDDLAFGGSTDDLFSLGDGNNLAYGNNGNDIFLTGSGDDVIYGGVNRNYIYTGAGNDLIYGNRGTNIISAGTGDDIVYAGSGIDRLILDKGAGSVTVWNFEAIDDAIDLGATLTKTDTITTSLSGLNTQIYAGDDLLATLMNTQANIDIKRI